MTPLERVEADLNALEAVLRAGAWPTGLALTDRERNHLEAARRRLELERARLREGVA